MELNQSLSFVAPHADSRWGTFLAALDSIECYLGPLARFSETPRRPRRALTVDIPIEMDDSRVAHFEGHRPLSAREQRGLYP